MNTTINSFRDLIVWQKSADLAVLVYEVTEIFRKSELYGITSQMRRAVISFSSNIAEGFGRNHKKEKIQFYAVAHSSCAEFESQLEISRKPSFINDSDFELVLKALIEVSKMVNGLMQFTNKRLFSAVFCELSRSWFNLHRHIAT